MGNHLRHSNECENCGYTVELIYCSNCGKKNVETRQSFGHLIGHFAEDFTHYDSNFWRTIKYLLFRPAKLTKTYLEGHRQKFVAPVKLYIFISFVTFLLMGLLPNNEGVSESTAKKENAATNHKKANATSVSMGGHTFHSLEELNSFQHSAGAENKLAAYQYWLAKASLNAQEKNLEQSDFAEAFIHTLPKALFLYLPIFAFWLWLFHGKRRWYFFDHGIFTLHYFSFLLLLLSIYRITIFLIELVTPDTETISFILGFTLFCYAFFYFFRAHSRMYGEKKWISRLKSLVLFFINSVAILIGLTIATIYVLLNLH